MTKQEYRNHVHTVVDLVMDIQELNCEVGNDVTVSMETFRETDIVRVWVNKKGERLKHYLFRQDMKIWDTEPAKIIRMLQEIKAKLENKE